MIIENVSADKIEMKGDSMKLIQSLVSQENKYVINGVTYIVSSSFQTAKNKDSKRFNDKLKNIIKNDIVPLTDETT